MKHEKIKYVNHNGEEMIWGGGENSIFVNANTLHDYKWSIDSDKNNIKAFERGIVDFEVPIVIACRTEKEGNYIKNKLVELVDVDVNAKEPGKLYVGEYYIKCYVSASSKSKYNMTDRFASASLTITTASPYWIREKTYRFHMYPDVKDLDYPHDCPYGYSMNSIKTIIVNKLNNSSYLTADFRLDIYGEVDSPCLSIDGHNYAVDCIVNEGEILTIDTFEKQVYRTVNGNRINEFKNRNREEYIFEPLNSGIIKLNNFGRFPYTITVYEKRSEPLWI